MTPWIDWYNALLKPSWTPPPSAISLIWLLLYPVIAVSFGFVLIQACRKQLPWKAALPFALNLTANLLFMPVFSGLRNLPLASLVIVIVWATLIWCIVAIWRHYRWIAIAQGPYLVWVSIATVLQLSITAMNWGVTR